VATHPQSAAVHVDQQITGPASGQSPKKQTGQKQTYVKFHGANDGANDRANGVVVCTYYAASQAIARQMQTSDVPFVKAVFA